MLKSQNFEIIYKIKVKNWTFLYLVLCCFYNNRVKVEVARAFSILCRTNWSLCIKCQNFCNPRFFGILGAWLSDKLKYPRCTSVLPTLRVAILPTFRVAILPTAFLARLQFFRQLFCTLLKLYIAAIKILKT